MTRFPPQSKLSYFWAKYFIRREDGRELHHNSPSSSSSTWAGLYFLFGIFFSPSKLVSLQAFTPAAEFRFGSITVFSLLLLRSVQHEAILIFFVELLSVGPFEFMLISDVGMWVFVSSNSVITWKVWHFRVIGVRIFSYHASYCQYFCSFSFCELGIEGYT